jgi:photosystem II stability/assembly factor-like uncharacterized protein
MSAIKQKACFIASICFLIFGLVPKGICQWTLIQGPKTGVYALEGVDAIAMKGANLYAACKAQGGVFRSTNNGTDWVEVHTGLRCDSVYALASNGTDLFSGSFVGASRLNDDDTSWTLVDSGLNPGYVRAMVVNGSNVFVSMAGSGVFLSTNYGSNWTEENNGLTDTNYVQAFAASGSDLFAGTYRNGVFRSTDNGTNWNEVSNGLACLHVNAIAVNAMNLFAGTRDSGIYRSTDNGTNWNIANSGLTDSNVTALTTSGTYVFAGTGYGGVFLTTDNGANWKAVNSGLTDFDVWTLFATAKYLFAGTGFNVWRRPLSDFGISSVESSVSQSGKLFISPNPASSIIAVRKAPSNLSYVKINNVLGMTVIEIPVTQASDFIIDVSKLPHGIYYAEFLTDRLIVERRFLKL